MSKNRFNQIEDYFLNELSEEEIGHEIINGQNTILLSAPHSVSQFREGSVKIGEYRTGLIVKLLSEQTNCHVMFKVKNLNDDANYDEISNYKNDLIKYIKENHIKLVLDLHLTSPKRDFDIEIGTGFKKNIMDREDIYNVIKKNLEKSYSDVRVDNLFPASYPNTVSATVAKLAGIAAIQLEINFNIVSGDSELEFFNHNMVEIISELEKLL